MFCDPAIAPVLNCGWNRLVALSPPPPVPIVMAIPKQATMPV